uniref:High mobility group box n=1 Tax=Marseillevirus LCMAC201 TaxID=2506605 RepID=A0A481YW07_9VIRU|nr:MAG: high mobility group box [Marseillevirus LCMAC201]
MSFSGLSSGYGLYSDTIRKEVQERDATEHITVKELGRMWRGLDDKQRAKWNSMAVKQKKEVKSEHGVSSTVERTNGSIRSTDDSGNKVAVKNRVSLHSLEDTVVPKECSGAILGGFGDRSGESRTNGYLLFSRENWNVMKSSSSFTTIIHHITHAYLDEKVEWMWEQLTDEEREGWELLAIKKQEEACRLTEGYFLFLIENRQNIRDIYPDRDIVCHLRENGGTTWTKLSKEDKEEWATKVERLNR